MSHKRPGRPQAIVEILKKHPWMGTGALAARVGMTRGGCTSALSKMDVESRMSEMGYSEKEWRLR